MEDTAVFEFFVRKVSPQRKFFMAAGLEQVVEFLEGLRFAPWELEWISESGRFSQSFVDYLEQLRFTGDLHAMGEGTVFFPNEPIARISAPLPQAQLVETRLINLLHYQTVVASKAARIVLAASGKPVIDFGLRRAHGPRPDFLPRGRVTLPGLREPRPSWLEPCSISRCLAPWRIHLFKLMGVNPMPFTILRTLCLKM